MSWLYQSVGGVGWVCHWWIVDGVRTGAVGVSLSRGWLVGVEPKLLPGPLGALSEFQSHLANEKRTGCVIGSGAGRKNEEELRQAILGVLKLKKPVVLDADSLNVFEGKAEKLFSSLHGQCVLTPHEGEFARLFPGLNGSREERAAAAARITGGIILLKGKETVVCNPAGEMVINYHSTPYLATAGSGDVLAGMIGSLLVQGMRPDMACVAAAWIHGDAAIQFGAGLTAPDIIQGIPGVLTRHL